MPTTVRIATFNVENLDDVPGQDPDLATRIAVMQSPAGHHTPIAQSISPLSLAVPRGSKRADEN